MYADISSGCQKYYECIYTGTVNQAIYNKTCLNGLAFDAKGIKNCRYPNEFTCSWNYLNINN